MPDTVVDANIRPTSTGRRSATAGTEVAARGRRWPRRALGVAVAVLLVGNGLALYLHQEPTELTVDGAVSRFRDRTAEDASAAAGPAEAGSADGESVPAPAGGPAAPASGASRATPAAGGTGPAAAAPAPKPTPGEGVYVYATSGYESTDALGGSRHDYPAQTTLTVRHGGCGWSERWEPLAERWDESHLCNEANGVAIRTFKTYHEFFQRSQQQDYDCPAGSHVGRDHQQPGATWTWGCSSSFGRIATNVVYVGTEQLDIGGVKVTVEHLRYDSQMTGSNRGTQHQERWVDRATGLSVRIENDIDTETDSPFGTVNYEEHYTITLTSMTPRR